MCENNTEWKFYSNKKDIISSIINLIQLILAMTNDINADYDGWY